jgi:hypothetical protein
MIDFSQIHFPCEAECLKKGQIIWEKCLVLNVFPQGSLLSGNQTCDLFWLVVDQNGEVFKIRKLEHVRFSNISHTS